jgi:hypothetical protein
MANLRLLGQPNTFLAPAAADEMTIAQEEIFGPVMQVPRPRRRRRRATLTPPPPPRRTVFSLEQCSAV